ncbi:hypothetical protein AB0C34_20925 [Nocardia sp. NPDC049220]
MTAHPTAHDPHHEPATDQDVTLLAERDSREWPHALIEFQHRSA